MDVLSYPVANITRALFEQLFKLLNGPTGIVENTFKQFGMKDLPGMIRDGYSLALGVSINLMAAALPDFGEPAPF